MKKLSNTVADCVDCFYRLIEAIQVILIKFKTVQQNFGFFTLFFCFLVFLLNDNNTCLTERYIRHVQTKGVYCTDKLQNIKNLFFDNVSLWSS